MRRARFLLVLLVTVAVACGGDSTGPDGGVDGFLRARVNNAAWEGEQGSLVIGAVRTTPGTHTITGTSAGAGGYTISLQIYNVTQPGTYALGVGPQMFGGYAIVAQTGAPGWTTPLSGTAGQVVLTTLTDSRIAGTFSFTATGVTGTGSLSVTNGEFDLPIISTVPLGPLPENAGIRFSGTFGGNAFTAGAVGVALTTGQNPTLSISASTVERNLIISVANMTGPGTFALSNTAPVRSMLLSQLLGSVYGSWSSAVTGASGSVTITAVNANRIQGSFTATLPALGSPATGTVTVSGTFDIGRATQG